MTPTNPLYDKVIIRKSHFAEICAMLNPLNQEQDRVANKAMRLLAQDLIGWAAVLVEPTWKQEAEGAKFVNPDGSDASTVYSAMLAACPPLPGGGE